MLKGLPTPGKDGQVSKQLSFRELSALVDFQENGSMDKGTHIRPTRNTLLEEAVLELNLKGHLGIS